jgi:sec-independent protein translocase protein TatB
MFGIGFSELLLISIVALIVIGPERLPKVARTVGAWVGRLNRYAAQIKADIDREMHLDELRNVQQSMKDSVQKYEIMTEETAQQVKQESGELKKAVQEAVGEASVETNGAKPQVVDHAPEATVSEHKAS